MKRFFVASLMIVIVGGGLFAYFWYKDWIENRVSPAMPQALLALKSDDAIEVSVGDWIVFRPRHVEAETALIFYPGGECDERGYAEPLRKIAGAGYLVVLVPMPFYLAVLAPNRAEQVIEAFPEIRDWAIGGHSLGGAMAARFVYEHPDRVAGLILWDAYPPDTDDLSDRSIRVKLIHRADASGAMPSYYEDYIPLLPPDSEFAPIEGASHINFGRFSPAERFRKTPAATIPIEAQHAAIARASIEFLAQIR
jgi:pimeloyl-ACP methyl ester carboxylesterase